MDHDIFKLHHPFGMLVAGPRFKPGLADIKTLLTQLVECQPHELKAVGSIPTRGRSCF